MDMIKNLKIHGGVIADTEEYIDDEILGLLFIKFTNWAYASDIGDDGDIMINITYADGEELNPVFTDLYAALDFLRELMKFQNNT